ncbi:MAG: hypothetical protein AAGM38_04900 [Pseudomonadota bacterium]
MHIGLALLAVLGAVAIWIWRARMAAEAGREAIDAADDVRAALRRFGFRRQAGRHPADLVDDARLAAAGMMAAIARMDGALTVAQTNAIRVECRASFRTSQQDADDIAAYGRWLADQSQDPEDALRRLGARVKKLAGEEAQSDLILMLERVAAVENGVSKDQRIAIDQLRKRLANA